MFSQSYIAYMDPVGKLTTYLPYSVVSPCGGCSCVRTALRPVDAAPLMLLTFRIIMRHQSVPRPVPQRFIDAARTCVGVSMLSTGF